MLEFTLDLAHTRRSRIFRAIESISGVYREVHCTEN